MGVSIGEVHPNQGWWVHFSDQALYLSTRVCHLYKSFLNCPRNLTPYAVCARALRIKCQLLGGLAWVDMGLATGVTPEVQVPGACGVSNRGRWWFWPQRWGQEKLCPSWEDSNIVYSGHSYWGEWSNWSSLQHLTGTAAHSPCAWCLLLTGAGKLLVFSTMPCGLTSYMCFFGMCNILPNFKLDWQWVGDARLGQSYQVGRGPVLVFGRDLWACKTRVPVIQECECMHLPTNDLLPASK